LPSTPQCFQASRGGSAGGVPTSRHNNPNYLDNATIVYTSAAIGIVHDLSTNRQVYFEEHRDDITCLAISADGRFAATGVIGKEAVVHIWETNIPVNGNPSDALIRTIGLTNNDDVPAGRDGTGNAINGVGGAGISSNKGRKGSEFQRGVCALEFSYDNKYLIAIGCDDNHTMGIFDLTNGVKVYSVASSHGIPPQIKWMKYCPSAQHTEYITREHAGLCDLFATAGNSMLLLLFHLLPQTFPTSIR
jgi:WD40 repeat protein